MATITVTKGYNHPTGFVSNQVITPGILNSAQTPSVTIADIVNADISSTAAIADTKLATISTAGKVANAATTATNANTASAIVARDASGNFSAGTITANLTGNVTGNVTGTASVIADGAVSSAAKISNGVISAEKLNGQQSGSAPIYGCRAWAKFEGRSTNGACTVNASGNVTSVSRISIGVYEVVMTTAPSSSDANYAILVSSNQISRVESITETSTTFRLNFINTVPAQVDPVEAAFCVIR
jgi:hypothetical protein